MARRHTAATLRIQQRLDATTLADLSALVQQQADEIEDLKRRLAWAEDDAERWRTDFLDNLHDNGLQPGLTMDGHVHALPAPQGALQ